MKTKYDWSNVPKEVKWIATDADGWQTQHTEKPKKLGRDWIDDTESGYFGIKMPQHNPYKSNWRDSLEERPQ